MVVIFCLMAASCLNPALDTVETRENQAVEDAITAKDFKVDAVSGFNIRDETAGPGGIVATLTLLDDTWKTELVEGYDDNHLFVIRDPQPEPKGDGEEENSPEEETDLAVKKEIVIGDGVTLELESYQISVKIYNEEYPNDDDKIFYKTIRFVVTATPAPFKAAPSVVPVITAPGQNKLTVSWVNTSGADYYNIYLGTSADMPETPFNTDRISVSPDITTNYEITDIVDDDTDGYLPPATTYYVRVDAVNGDGPTLSQVIKRTTSYVIGCNLNDPDDQNNPHNSDFFWKDEDGNSFISWDSVPDVNFQNSGLDMYRIRQPSEAEPGGYMTYGGEGQIGALVGYEGHIRYHVAFDSQEAARKAPHTQYGHYTTNERLDGRPAGVFIVEYKKPQGSNNDRIYQGVYYWGVGATQTSNALHGQQGKTLCYFSNSYGLASAGKVDGKFHGNPETSTLGAAIDRFTLDNMVEFIAFVAIPWYRVYTPYSWMK